MRSSIRKPLVGAFQQAFEAKYPQFSLLKLPRGSPSIWEWRLAPNLVFFVVLSPFDDEDSFAIEVAWSEDGEFPWSSIGKTFGVEKPCCRERLAALWAPLGEEAFWELAPEVRIARNARWEALERGESVTYPPPPPVDAIVPRIPAFVDDCLQKIQQYGLPLFEQVARTRGVESIF